MSPTLIQHYMDYSSLHPHLFVTIHSNIENPGSHHLTSIYLLIKVKYIFIVVSELLICALVKGKKIFTNYNKMLLYCPFAFSLTVSTSFQNYLDGHPFSQSTSVRLFHTLVTRFDYFVTIYIPFWDTPQSPK